MVCSVGWCVVWDVTGEGGEWGGVGGVGLEEKLGENSKGRRADQFVC